MDDRLVIHELLVNTLGSKHVYFQPPENIKLVYPAIVYSRSDIRKKFADNGSYSVRTIYDVTLIDKNPDSPIVYRLAELPKCTHSRHWVVDNLNHDSFTIYN